MGQRQSRPAPALAPVTVDVKTTALIVMDLVKGSCNDQRRPRCVAQIPAIAKLLNEARAKGMTVIDTTAGSGPVEDILPPVAPKAGETVLTGTVADKFIRTDLEKILKDKGMTTVITVGTSAQGAVLYTASGAALRRFKVIVPVDGSSSESLCRAGRGLALEPRARRGAAGDAHDHRYDQVLRTSLVVRSQVRASRTTVGGMPRSTPSNCESITGGAAVPSLRAAAADLASSRRVLPASLLPQQADHEEGHEREAEQAH